MTYATPDLINVLTPVGRIVSGSLYQGQTKEFKTNSPLMTKDGLPKTQYFFALAIPKRGETHWNQTAWGKGIYEFGKSKFPQFFTRGDYPKFAWKISDGDDTTPNSNNKILAEKEGYAGHWILSFTSNLIMNADGTTKGRAGFGVYRKNTAGRAEVVTQQDYVNKGDYVRVAFHVVQNSDANTPSVYLNVDGVEFIQFGERIYSSSFDPDSAFNAPVDYMPEGVVPAPAEPVAPVAVPTPVQTVAPAPKVVEPYTPPLSAPAPAPAPAPVRQMAKDCPWTYEQLLEAGHTDATMRQAGYLI